MNGEPETPEQRKERVLKLLERAQIKAHVGFISQEWGLKDKTILTAIRQARDYIRRTE